MKQISSLFFKALGASHHLCHKVRPPHHDSTTLAPGSCLFSHIIPLRPVSPRGLPNLFLSLALALGVSPMADSFSSFRWQSNSHLRERPSLTVSSEVFYTNYLSFDDMVAFLHSMFCCLQLHLFPYLFIVWLYCLSVSFKCLLNHCFTIPSTMTDIILFFFFFIIIVMNETKWTTELLDVT